MDKYSEREAELAFVLADATVDMLDAVDEALRNYTDMLLSVIAADYKWESDRGHDIRALRALLSRVVFSRVADRARKVMDYDA